MDNKQKQAINRYIDTRFNEFTRQSLFGANLNPKHTNMYAEYGWTEAPTFNDFKLAYKYIAAAFGLVQAINRGSFQTIPEYVFADAPVSAKNPQEVEVNAFIHKWWHKIKEADRLNLIGSYSALIIIAADNVTDTGKELGTLNSLSDIIDLIPADEEQLIVSDWYQELSDGINYGKPKMYQFREFDPMNTSTQPKRTVNVHPSRVITLCEGAVGNSFFGTSILEPVFTNIQDIQKILGANAEGFFKNAARHIAMSFDKDVSFTNVAQNLGLDPNDPKSIGYVNERMTEKFKNLSSGFDAATYGSGTDYTVLSVDMTNPEQPILQQMNMIAFATGRSIKGMLGTQTGERASSEDTIKDSRLDMERQQNFIGRAVLCQIIDRLTKYGALESHEYRFAWENLLEPTSAIKIENMLSASEAAAKQLEAFGRTAITENEIRNLVGLSSLAELEEDLPPIIEDDE